MGANRSAKTGSVGFWVIDYKTGKAGYYTGADLKEYRRLQLTLYALAVEEVFLAGRPARPLELAYWLVTEDSPLIARIRGNVIVGINPATDPDGRDRYTDWYLRNKIDDTDDLNADYE